MKISEAALSIETHFQEWKLHLPEKTEALNSGSGSNRLYYRVFYLEKTCLATINSDVRENEAFFYLASFYKKQGINVPEVFYISKDRTLYFQQDLGDENLLQLLKKEGCNNRVKLLYQDSLKQLINMQFSTEGLDFQNCYPRSSFDEQAILWDLNYFKYYFLKVSGIDFDEQLLENDLQNLAKSLAITEESYFMFRDFQARNIQIFNNQPWFIDFQGGRRGPFLYDVASLLFQASAGLSQEFRNEMLDFYHAEIQKRISISRDKFEHDFQLMVFIRIIQTLGAYGFRGLIEGKEYFKNSIPMALNNLQSLLKEWHSDIEIPYFLTILARLLEIKNKFED